MVIQRGEIYFIDLNPTQGREQAGQRPALVLSIDAINRLPLVVTVVAGTTGENIPRDHPTNVRVSPEESSLPLETVFLPWLPRTANFGLEMQARNAWVPSPPKRDGQRHCFPRRALSR